MASVAVRRCWFYARSRQWKNRSTRHLLAGSGGTLEELQALARLAFTAYHAGDGEVPDDEVREGGLHAAGLAGLGL